MELLHFFVAVSALSLFNGAYFTSFVLFYLLCKIIINSKINIEVNNDPIVAFLNCLHLILNISSITLDFMLFKMRQNKYLNILMTTYDYMNQVFQIIQDKIRNTISYCCRKSTKVLTTHREIDVFLNTLND